MEARSAPAACRPAFAGRPSLAEKFSFNDLFLRAPNFSFKRKKKIFLLWLYSRFWRERRRERSLSRHGGTEARRKEGVGGRNSAAPVCLSLKFFFGRGLGAGCKILRLTLKICYNKNANKEAQETNKMPKIPSVNRERERERE